MSNNTPQTARNLGLLGSTQIINDFVGPLDPNDFFKFSLDGLSDFSLDINGNGRNYGLEFFNDRNDNEQMDQGENLFSINNGSISSSNRINFNLSSTQRNGVLQRRFILTGLLDAGNYFVRVFLPTANNNYTMSLGASNISGGIQGTRWHDLNGDGVQDAGEPGLAGGTIYLDTNNNGQQDGGETSTTTDINGNYNFTNLAPGNYTVREVLPNGWMRSAPPSGFYNVSVTSGNTVTEQNFGSFQTATINGSKWNDINGDGIWDAGEPGLAGWTIYLDQNQNGQLDAGETSTITDVNGNYTFTGLSPGTYTVAEVLQPGWEQTFPGSGGGMPTPQFQIDLNFLDSNLTPSQQAIFTQASQRWSEIITADLPDIMTANLGLIDDLFIEVSTPAIDGVGNIVGQARPTALRPGSFLPYTGTMEFDIADLANLEANGRLEDVILHEMGHVLGIGTIWDNLNLLSGNNTADPQFLGAAATAEYNNIFNLNASSVPVEAGGGPGTAYSHWRESIFDNELMTGFLDFGVDNPLSRITIASLADIGYQVDLTAADPYFPPTAPIVAFSSQKRVGKFIAPDKNATVVDPVSTVNFANNTALGVHTVDLTSGETANSINFGNQFFNQSPIAVDDTAITDEDTSINIAVLANDSDPNVGDLLTISNIDSSNTQGTVILNPDNTISYDPTAAYQYLDTGESATDSFTYTLSDGNATDTATVTVTINGINDAPILSSVNKIGDEDTIINFSAADFIDAFSDPEGNSLSEIHIISLPDLGILNVNGSPINAGDVIAIADLNNLTFAPSANFNGTTSFAWNATDGNLLGVGAAVNLVINAVNDLPIALDDSATTVQDQSATIDVLANDSDPVDGDPLSIDTFDATSTFGGAIALDNNSTPNDLTDDRLIYTPATGYIGTDSFSYAISDGNGGSATATVNITVNPADPLVLIGTPGDDTLVADSGDDFLFSLGGNDILQGQAGNDVAYGGQGNDSLLGGDGQDRLFGEQDRDFLQGGNGGDFLNGGTGDDLLFGDGDDDTLIGGIGDDFLQGGDGNDWLEGSAGIDRLFGGSGNDGFVLRSGEGIDVVFDFSDGNDLFLLADGLTFSQLNIISSGNSTLISDNSSGEQLAYVFAVSSVLISETDFVSV